MNKETVTTSTPEIKGTPVKEENTLEGHLAEFGLSLDRDNLSGYDLYILAASKRLEDYIDDIKIPIAISKEPTNEKQIIEREIEKTIEKTSYQEGDKPSLIPADGMDVGLIEKLEDLPTILPSQWLYEELAPDYFNSKLVNHQFLQTQWREHTRTPVTTYETVKEKIFEEVPAPPKELKQHAYCLVDTSGSMDCGDGREEVMKALTVAFLKKGFHQRAQLAVRPFTVSAGELSEGKSEQEFAKIVKRILGLGMGGGTNIECALSQAVADIKRGGIFDHADILLITDGLSSLNSNPLGKIRLHTIVLGETGYDPQLPQWSATFKKIDVSEFATALTSDQEEFQRLEGESKAIGEKMNQITNQQQLDAFIQRAQLLQDYTHQLDRHNNQLEVKQQVQLQTALNKANEVTNSRNLIELQKKVSRLEEEKRRKAEEERRIKAVQAELEAKRKKTLEEQLVKLREQMGQVGESKPNEKQQPQQEPAISQLNPQQNNPEEIIYRSSLWEKIKKWGVKIKKRYLDPR